MRGLNRSPYSKYVTKCAAGAVQIASRTVGGLEALAQVVYQCTNLRHLQRFDVRSFGDPGVGVQVKRLLARGYEKDAASTRGLVCELLVLRKLTEKWPDAVFRQWVSFAELAEVPSCCAGKSVDLYSGQRQEAVECKTSLVDWLFHLGSRVNGSEEVYCFGMLREKRRAKRLAIAFATLDPSIWRPYIDGQFKGAGFVPDTVYHFDQFPPSVQ